MAVSVNELQLNPVQKTAKVSLFCDQKSDITDSMVVDGVPEGYELELGSSAMTASGELAFYKSTGQWNWV